MSAECGRCGQDLVYPVGFPMVGVCVGCNAEDDRDHLASVIQKAYRLLSNVSWLAHDERTNRRWVSEATEVLRESVASRENLASEEGQ